MIYALSILGSIYIAKGIKNASISQLHSSYTNNSVNISILKQSEAEIKELMSLAESNFSVDSLINSKIRNEKMINYLLPADMYISEIPMERPDVETCHVYSNEYNSKLYKLVYTTASIKEKTGQVSGSEILIKSLSTIPLLEVWIDLTKKQILKIIPLSGTQRYENIPEPVF